MYLIVNQWHNLTRDVNIEYSFHSLNIYRTASSLDVCRTCRILGSLQWHTLYRFGIKFISLVHQLSFCFCLTTKEQSVNDFLMELTIIKRARVGILIFHEFFFLFIKIYDELCASNHWNVFIHFYKHYQKIKHTLIKPSG